MRVADSAKERLGMGRIRGKSKPERRLRRLNLEKLESRILPSADSSFLRGTPDSETSSFESESLVVEQEEVSVVFSPADLPEAIASSSDSSSSKTTWYEFTTDINPSGDEQELLEQINRLRADPQGELDRLFSYYDDETLVARNSLVAAALKLNSYPKDSVEDFLEYWSGLTTQAPLAFNSSLMSAASSHSSHMKTRNDISHKCYGEDDLAARVAKAGFDAGLVVDGSIAVSENIGGCFRANGEFSIASHMLAAFAIDWGVPTHEHLDAMMNAAYAEIGVSIMETSKSIGPYIVTCDLGTSVEGARSDGAYLLGVIYNDSDSDQFYDSGEGLQDISISIQREGSSATQTVEIASWSSGGYQIFLLNGSYNITVSGDGLATPITKRVVISDGINVKLDFRSDEAGSAPPVVDLNGDEEGVDLTFSFVEGTETAVNALDSSRLSVTDADSSELYGAKIYFSERIDGAQETLDISVSGTELSASFDDQMGVIEITGAGTLEEYSSVIASLKYYNANDSCDISLARSVKISVFDGVYWSSEATLTITIAPQDIPSMTVHEMTVYEGDEGVKLAAFVVELDSPARLDATFRVRIKEGGTAVEGDDFVIVKKDAVSISVGETTARIECYVVGNYNVNKPEGLEKTIQGFENPFVYFELEIYDVENALLTNEGGVVKGIIYDDDSPVALGVTDNVSISDALPTENGDRRYVFTVTPSASGYYSWEISSTAGLENARITVRKNSLRSEIIAESVDVASGARAQWIADPDCEYWITVQSDSDIEIVKARLLEVDDDRIILVDPLLGDSDDALVDLMWIDDSLETTIGNWTWRFDADFWNGATIKTELEDVIFSAQLRSQTVNSLVASDKDSSSLTMDGLSISVGGFAGFVVWGNDENEEISLVGTDGCDSLRYSEGIGSFQLSDGRIYSFQRVNKVTIDGVDGEDYAYIEDSPENDTLETSNSFLTLSGGGFALAVANFAKTLVMFNKGGSDVHIARDSGDDVQIALTSGTSITTGCYIVSNDLEQDSIQPQRKYSRSVLGAEKTIVSPVSNISSVSLNDAGTSWSIVDVSIGNLSAYDESCDRAAVVSNVKNLVVSNVHQLQLARDSFTVQLPSEYDYASSSDYVSIVDKTSGWELKIPAWAFSETEDATSELASASFLDASEIFCEYDQIEQDLLNSSELGCEIANVIDELAMIIVEEEAQTDNLTSESVADEPATGELNAKSEKFVWLPPLDNEERWFSDTNDLRKRTRHYS